MHKINLPKIVRSLILFLLHTSALYGIYYFLQPFIKWYLTKIPALGIDLYYSITSVSLLQKSFSFWFSGYRDVWFAGNPLVGDFPRFQFYLMIPLSNIFGTVRGVQLTVLVALFLLLAGCYFLYFKISRNIGLAFFLTILILLSVNIYGSATWGGSLPYFNTQLFLPIVLYFIIYYLQTNSIRWLYAGSLFAGLAFLGHPLPVLGFIFPLVTILLITYPQSNLPLFPLKRFILTKILTVIKFFTAVIFVAFILLGGVVYDFIFNFFARFRGLVRVGESIGAVSSATNATSDTGQAIANFYKSQVQTLITGSNNLLTTFLIIGICIFVLMFVIHLIFRKKTSTYLQILPFVLMVLYIVWHVNHNLTGKNFFPQGLYRAFWPFPIVLGALIAATWRPLFIRDKEEDTEGLVSRITKVKKVVGVTTSFLITGIATLILVGASFIVFNQQIAKVIDKIHANSDTSSAFPEILSMKLDQKDQEALKKQLLPSFINPKDKTKRLYESDATVNIWWNSFYDTPLARGYSDPPIGTDRRGSFFLLDIAVGNNVLEREFKFPTAMAKNYAQYLMDWYSIYYFEGGHLAPSSNAPPSTYLTDVFEKKEDVTTYGAIWRYQSKSGRPEARFDLPQTLKYYKVKEDLVSPVVHATDAPAILIISDFPGYEQIWRMLAGENLNSHYIVTINQDKFIDSFNKNDLENFDAVILHNYDYKNKQRSFNMLKDYVQKGGKLFVDTGGEVKDSQSNDLSDFFPFKQTARKELTTSWDLKTEEDPITHGIDFSKFGPPIFNKNPWKFSYPVEINDSTAKVLLKNHNKPILITKNMGSGKIIWSGMNLPYHYVQYTNAEESKFFRQILAQLIPLNRNGVIPVNATWEKPESIKIIGDKKAKGLLVKEELYEGWSLKKVKGGNESFKIYKAGPTYPGFMYIPLKDSTNYELRFNFNGIFISWIYAFVSLISIIIILEMIIFNGRFIGTRFSLLGVKAKKKASSWWEKEEELE